MGFFKRLAELERMERAHAARAEWAHATLGEIADEISGVRRTLASVDNRAAQNANRLDEIEQRLALLESGQADVNNEFRGTRVGIAMLDGRTMENKERIDALQGGTPWTTMVEIRDAWREYLAEVSDRVDAIETRIALDA